VSCDHVEGYGGRNGVAVGVVRILGKVLAVSVLNTWYKYWGRVVGTKEADSEI